MYCTQGNDRMGASYRVICVEQMSCTLLRTVWTRENCYIWYQQNRTNTFCVDDKRINWVFYQQWQPHLRQLQEHPHIL